MTLHLYHSDVAAEILLEEQIEAEKTAELHRHRWQMVLDTIASGSLSTQQKVSTIAEIARDALR